MLKALSVGAASGKTSVRQAAQIIVKVAANGRGRIGEFGVAATARPALLSTAVPCAILTHPGDVCGQLLAALHGHLPLLLQDVDGSLGLARWAQKKGRNVLCRYVSREPS